MFINHQKGVGLLEVMVALMLLGIAVLGFVAMQLRANKVSIEADNNMHAVELARDLHERMRINREGISTYNNSYKGVPNLNPPPSKTSDLNHPDNPLHPKNKCRNANCTPNELAVFDFEQVRKNADNLGMQIAVRQCPSPISSTTEQRHCIYVAWGDTTATIGNSAPNCTKNDATYVDNAQCIFMESFSYVQ